MHYQVVAPKVALIASWTAIPLWDTLFFQCTVQSYNKCINKLITNIFKQCAYFLLQSISHWLIFLNCHNNYYNDYNGTTITFILWNIHIEKMNWKLWNTIISHTLKFKSEKWLSFHFYTIQFTIGNHKQIARTRKQHL